MKKKNTAPASIKKKWRLAEKNKGKEKKGRKITVKRKIVLPFLFD